MTAEPRPREVTVEPLDPIDCIFVVAELTLLEDRHSLHGRGERALRCRRVREALERAVYGRSMERTAETELRAML